MRIHKRRSIPATRNRLTAAREQQVLSAIEFEGKTISEISIQIKVPEARVRYALRVLHQSERVFVQAWVGVVSHDGKHRTTPAFKAGEGWDQCPPAPVRCRGMNLRIEPVGHPVQSIFFLWITGDSNA